jgi:hypothetical protein
MPMSLLRGCIGSAGKGLARHPVPVLLLALLVAVHAKDDIAKRFYERFDCTSSPTERCICSCF